MNQNAGTWLRQAFCNSSTNTAARASDQRRPGLGFRWCAHESISWP